jgi:hypothetical protein
MLDKIAMLGKLAAKKRYSKSYLLPPKRRAGQSKLYKYRTKKEKKEAQRAMKESTGNVQSPHRYGRKKDTA